MQLSNEDLLRLNVLLRQNVKAIRIDESRLTVHALTDKGEAKVTLNPNGREELYLRLVRELLSTHVLGSPGGYPVYIRRWTRMGQARDKESLEKLLLLGEPEAVTAVVHAPELNREIATRAWWSYPNADNARQLLAKPLVANTDLGRELAEFLLEFLPFEAEAKAMIDSVRLVLQPNLLSAKAIDTLWKRGRRKQAYFIGFLQAVPDALPEAGRASPLHNELQSKLAPLAQTNPLAAALLRTLSPQGQLFFKTAANVMDKIASQEAVVELMAALANYLSDIRPDAKHYRSIEEIEARIAIEYETQGCPYHQCLDCMVEYQALFNALLRLSMASEFLVAPILGRTDAIGSVMRRRLEPVTQPLMTAMRTLNTQIKV